MRRHIRAFIAITTFMVMAAFQTVALYAEEPPQLADINTEQVEGLILNYTRDEDEVGEMSNEEYLNALVAALNGEGDEDFDASINIGVGESGEDATLTVDELSGVLDTLIMDGVTNLEAVVDEDLYGIELPDNIHDLIGDADFAENGGYVVAEIEGMPIIITLQMELEQEGAYLDDGKWYLDGEEVGQDFWRYVGYTEDGVVLFTADEDGEISYYEYLGVGTEESNHLLYSDEEKSVLITSLDGLSDALSGGGDGGLRLPEDEGEYTEGLFPDESKLTILMSTDSEEKWMVYAGKWEIPVDEDGDGEFDDQWEIVFYADEDGEMVYDLTEFLKYADGYFYDTDTELDYGEFEMDEEVYEDWHGLWLDDWLSENEVSEDGITYDEDAHKEIEKKYQFEKCALEGRACWFDGIDYPTAGQAFRFAIDGDAFEMRLDDGEYVCYELGNEDEVIFKAELDGELRYAEDDFERSTEAIESDLERIMEERDTAIRDSISGNSISENSVADDEASEDTVSGDAMSSASGNTVSGDDADKGDSAADDETKGEPSGDDDGGEEQPSNPVIEQPSVPEPPVQEEPVAVDESGSGDGDDDAFPGADEGSDSPNEPDEGDG